MVIILPFWKRRRLVNYDYAQEGLYFITICCKNKENYFWIKDEYNVGEIELTEAGKTVKEEIENIPVKYKGTRLDNYVVMPNHVHLIIEIENRSHIPTIVNQTKGKVSRTLGFSPWQRSYHDHIIRGDEDYENIWNYIESNPLKWNDDKFYNEM